jgi:glycosyltransferase involved in cell wall biosynthesis
MKSLRITIVLPFPVTKPVGGAKIMYEYANRLSDVGHDITVVHSIIRPFKKMKSPLWWKKFVFTLRGVQRPKWFPLHKKIPSLIVNEITDKYLPDGDIVFSTWWQMAYAISKLSPQKGKPVNLIQDFEVWGGQNEKVLASYRLPITHAVIALYLKNLLEEQDAEKIVYFPNAIDYRKFYIKNTIEARDPLSIIMLYSKEERKGSKFGIQALKDLKSEFAELKATLFGVYPRPADLPEWIGYQRKPDDLTSLFNNHAVFLSASLGEGWALPPAEAMACGCAVVCTDIGGHADYAINNETAILFKAADTEAMKDALKVLLLNNSKRIEIAKNSNRYLLENFNWARSVGIAEDCFISLL